MRAFSARTELAVTRVVGWVGIARGKFFDWCQRYGQANEHNALVPRDHWIEDGERQAILDYFDRHPLEGYRRLTFMMLDDDLVAVSAATTYRVLARAGRLDRWARTPSKKGTGFVQPLRPHEHWHIDVSYLNPGGTFYYLCSVLDGNSRTIIHWDLRESMKEQEVECILSGPRSPIRGAAGVSPDNGPQFVARTSRSSSGSRHDSCAHQSLYPQSNGKIERWHQTLKGDALRPAQPATVEEAQRIVARFVDHYNRVRLHSALGYVAPLAFMAGQAPAIWAERDRKLEAAREQRRQRREAQRAA